MDFNHKLLHYKNKVSLPKKNVDVDVLLITNWFFLKTGNILSPLVLTLSGIICFAIVFVLVTSLLIFICIRSQRLTNNSNDHHSLTPKKLDSLNHDQSITTTTTTRRSVCNGTSSIDCNGMIIVANDDYKINSMEKNILMKNTIMKMNGSNQILTTLTTTTNNGNLTNHHHHHHHSDLLTTANNTNNNGYNGLPPIYNNNDFLHSNNDSYTQYSQLNNLITRTNSNNGGQLIATTSTSTTTATTTYSSGQYLSTSLNDYGGGGGSVSDNIDHSSHCNANGLPISSYIHDNNNNDNKVNWEFIYKNIQIF